MRHKLFSFITLSVCLLSGHMALALEKTRIYDVAVGSRPAIAADNAGNLHIAYENPITYEIAKSPKESQDQAPSQVILPGLWYLQCSFNGEAKWTEPISITRLSGGSQQPDIAIENNGAVDLVWTGSDSTDKLTDIFFSRSTDSGHTWTKPIAIASTPGNSTEPAMAIAPDNSIHVAWSDTSRGEEHKDIYYSSSKDNGKTWGKNTLLPADDVSNTPGESSRPSIAVSKDGTIHLAWLDSTPGESHPDIYYAYKDGEYWSQPTNVSNSPRASSHPVIACSSKDKIYLSWGDNSRKENAADIWCAKAIEKGTFDRPINVSSTPGVASEPVIATGEAGEVAVVWSDTSNNPNKPDIYCRISNNGGNAFSRVINLSPTSQINLHPDVIIVGKKMLAVWEGVSGNSRQIKMASMELKDIPTGPVLNVSPDLRSSR
jgi:hypothetical protein